MAKQFRPMLSAKLEEPVFPYLVSAKLDGTRALVKDGQVLSRTLKPIPNKHIQSMLNNPALDGLDGEIICGDPTDKDCFRNTTTVVMSHDKVEPFTFYVFDDFTHPELPFQARIKFVQDRVNELGLHYIKPVHHYKVNTIEELALAEQQFLAKGYEGIMLRSPTGPYKSGRATVRENYLLKCKRYNDSEAIVIGFEERFHNANEAEESELGLTKRSHKQENMVPTNSLGALIVRDVVTGIEFKVGTGFTEAMRQEYWKDQQLLLGKQLTYKSFEIGVKEKPRHPVFVGWREEGF